ncbi:hypothetical protein APHCRT_0553 [Anaplasma phagocytophilum str. CRT53-1]|uniref:Uncharacterized protein n=1 Tax=Anaplasma phagocytophilum str. CRT53-1 TaxID=1359157 RepID=A0A0F3Q1P9_ANAPH|nr:hypothetical protein APHCRT_0553 [Anaplasma phagocytophilum str. CRT53-1]
MSMLQTVYKEKPTIRHDAKSILERKIIRTAGVFEEAV